MKPYFDPRAKIGSTLLRRTAGIFTSLLLLQSTLVAAGGAGCTPEKEGMPEASLTMNHPAMRGAAAALIHSTVRPVLAEQTRGESASGNEASTCFGMNVCASSSELAVAYIAPPLQQEITSHIVLSVSAPHSRGTSPDVPPPRK